MSFASDNWAGASDKVMAALGEANAGLAPAYANDTWTERARARLDAFFEREVAAFFVATGSAANSIALAHLHRAGGVTLAHTDSHIARDEAGGPHLFAPGLSLDLLDGPAGRITPEGLGARLAHYSDANVHQGRATTLSFTNVNEIGQAYRPDEVAALAEIAHGAGLAVHMDGARFMNALAFTGASAADLTWRAGVDILSLGLTKTGGWCAEAVILFDKAQAEDIAYRHKQAAQLFSKNRMVAAQFVALLGDDHALTLARHANAMARQLGETLEDCGVPLALPVQSNEVFAFVSDAAGENLIDGGVSAYPWTVHSAHAPVPPRDDMRLHRFVASFRTTEEDVAAVRVALMASAD